mmetsp:Transcript_122906/g.239052  ORF Transcript_122906/g.239052 Transcript_122906/m.239052 type:complete len:219 (-) Transcript_122906:1062-1718(-)
MNCVMEAGSVGSQRRFRWHGSSLIGGVGLSRYHEWWTNRKCSSNLVQSFLGWSQLEMLLTSLRKNSGGSTQKTRPHFGRTCRVMIETPRRAGVPTGPHEQTSTSASSSCPTVCKKTFCRSGDSCWQLGQTKRRPARCFTRLTTGGWSPPQFHATSVRGFWLFCTWKLPPCRCQRSGRCYRLFCREHQAHRANCRASLCRCAHIAKVCCRQLSGPALTL